MRDRQFERLHAILLDRGVSARYAARLIGELGDHCADIESERLAAGESPARAALTARHALGSELTIGALVLGRPELRGHWSSLRAVLRPLALALMPAERMEWGGPLAGAAIARWSASITFGALLTIALLFALARTLTLGA